MNMNKSIVELAEKYSTDKKMNNGKKCYNGNYGHNYAIYYDNILKTLDVKTMLEIGVSWGSSIKMWDEYFKGSVYIYGIDINEKRFKKSEIENNRIKILLGDQSNIKFLETLKTKLFDLIIDDGSHRMSHQQISFKILFKFLRNGGVYVIEDLHTSKHKSFFDSKNETTTIELLKKLKNKEIYKSNYLSKEEYQYLMDNISNIDIYEDEKIAFITKK